jgi:hypothetical protein
MIAPGMRAGPNRTLIASALALLVCLTSAAGCAAATDQWLTADQAAAEYRAEAEHLTLAPGWTWPSSLRYRKTAPDGNEIRYGAGSGKVDAAWHWHCSWARTYFTAKDPHDREVALGQVLLLKESAFYRYGLTEDDRPGRDRVLSLAAAGKPAELKSLVDLNCPGGNDFTVAR